MGLLSNKRALVCGGSKGIGRACAIDFAENGATVTILARDEAALKTVVSELPIPEGQVHGYLVADVSQSEPLYKQIKEHVESTGPYHILLNNSGGPAPGLIVDAEAEDFIKAIRTHVVANQIISTILLTGMEKENYGRIINIISTSVKQPIPGLGVSNTTRGGVASWAKTLSTEVAPTGITVNNILPGFTDTDRLQHLFKHRADKSGKSVEEVTKEAIDGIPMGRLAEPWEIAAAATFLASEKAGYITGINLPVDGGRTSSL